MEINYNIDNLFNKFYSGIPIYGIINATDSKSQYNKYLWELGFKLNNFEVQFIPLSKYERLSTYM